jgi:hypothetical protein
MQQGQASNDVIRGLLLGVCRGLAMILVAFAALALPASASAAEYVQNFTATELWSGPDAGAISFGTAPAWDYFQVVSHQPNGRLYVQVLRNQNFAFIESGHVGPSGPPPVGWPGVSAPRPVTVSQPAPPAGAVNQSLVGPLPGYSILADNSFLPALQLLHKQQHTWTLSALSSSATRLEWGPMPPDASGHYQPFRGAVTLNARWMRADPRAVAALIEHEAKHVADVLAGLDVNSPAGCLETEVNAFREEAKTWGKLVGQAGKPDPKDELELSLNYKLALYQRNPAEVELLISQNPGYRLQCRL